MSRPGDLGRSPRETGGLVHVSGRVNGGAIDTGRPHCSAAVSESGDTGETKKAAQRLFGNQALTVKPVTPLSPPPRHRAPTLQRHRLHSDTGETKSAAQRFFAIRTRSLHDPHGGLTVGVRPAGRCRESVPRVERGATLFGKQALKRRKRCNTGRPLNDLRSAVRPTRLTCTDASVPIRPPIPTPAQGVSNICAETDVLQR
jgi:hypothetical protein